MADDPPSNSDPSWAPDTDDPAALIAAGLVAFDFTRQYVGEEVLPAIEGWSWFDWCERAKEWLERQPERPIEPPSLLPVIELLDLIEDEFLQADGKDMFHVKALADLLREHTRG